MCVFVCIDQLVDQIVSTIMSCNYFCVWCFVSYSGVYPSNKNYLWNIETNQLQLSKTVELVKNFDTPQQRNIYQFKMLANITQK